jgi:hypothetical protein
MTCLIAWIGVDSRGPSSCYLAADSRFSWEKKVAWDGGRKIFCSRKSPDIWGYYGDVVFPTVVINQIIDAIDENQMSADPRSQTDFEWAFRHQLADYPLQKIGAFGVVHCRRIGCGVGSSFQIRHLSWDPTGQWKEETLELPPMSGLVGKFGSGATKFSHWSNKFKKSDVGGTSRAVFQAFCTMLHEGSDPNTGGAPQLVSLFRIGNGKLHGIVWNSDVWLAGLRLSNATLSVEVLNSQFERCDPITMKRLDDAQPQPFPPLD